jgi:PE family
MSFVTTQPEALAYAAGKLQTLGSAIAAESAAAATPTTGMVPAAADEVSALQAAIFGAYGSLYQSVNAQATTIHELFVHTLEASAGSYAATESANSAVTASPVSGRISGLLSSAASSTAAGTDPPGGNLANLFNIGTGNWGSASSDLIDLAQGGILPAANEGGDIAGNAAGVAGGLDGTVPTGAVAPAGSAGLGGGSDVGGPRPGGLGRRLVGAAQLGRGGCPGREPWRSNDRGLDHPCAAKHAGDNRAGRDALSGHGREGRRFGCAAVRRQAHRDGTADGRLGTESSPRSQPVNTKREFLE